MRMLNTTAPTKRATPSSTPSMRAVSIIAKILMAGPGVQKCNGGPQSGSPFVNT